MVVAVVPEIVGALVLLILAFAAFILFRPFIVGALQRLPLVGGWVSTQVNLLLLGVLVIAQSQIDAGVSALSGLFRAVFQDVWAHRVWVGLVFDSVYWSLWTVRYQVIPYVWASLGAHIDFVWGQLGAQINAVWAASSAYTTAVWRAATDYTTAVWRASTDYTTAVWRATTDHVDLIWRSLDLRIDGVWRDLGAHIDFVWGQVAAYAATLVGLEAGRAIAAERQIAIDAADWARGAASEAERLWADERARALAAEGAVGIAAAAALARVATAVKDIEDSPCMRSCGVLGDLGGLLQGLEDAALLGVVLDLAVQSAHDPKGAARSVQELSGPLSDMAKLARGLVGV